MEEYNLCRAHWLLILLVLLTINYIVKLCNPNHLVLTLLQVVKPLSRASPANRERCVSLHLHLQTYSVTVNELLHLSLCSSFLFLLCLITSISEDRLYFFQLFILMVVIKCFGSVLRLCLQSVKKGFSRELKGSICIRCCSKCSGWTDFTLVWKLSGMNTLKNKMLLSVYY